MKQQNIKSAFVSSWINRKCIRQFLHDLEPVSIQQTWLLLSLLFFIVTAWICPLIFLLFSPDPHRLLEPGQIASQLLNL